MKNIIFEREDRIAKITINRPEVRNALNLETRKELLSLLDEIKKDEKTIVVIVTGSGKSFIAGADIRDLKDMDSIQAFQYASTLGQKLYSEIASLEKITIASINGYALGGGCELAMACDLRIASSTALLGLPEVGVGIIPGGGGTQRLPLLTNPGLAKELIFTGNLIPAREAYRIGLVNKVVPPEKLEGETMELAKKIASKPPIALKLAKKALQGETSSYTHELHLFSLCFSSQDQKEGMQAFLEKRKPEFKGK
jgi:enoyl-CoA hydratase